MCAETDWRRCHRRLIADFLTARGHEVIHLLQPAIAKHCLGHPFIGKILDQMRDEGVRGIWRDNRSFGVPRLQIIYQRR